MTNLVTPPEAFAIVEKGIFRSNIPNNANFGYLKMLNLKTVLILSPEVPTRSLTTFLEDLNVKLVLSMI